MCVVRISNMALCPLEIKAFRTTWCLLGLANLICYRKNHSVFYALFYHTSLIHLVWRKKRIFWTPPGGLFHLSVLSCFILFSFWQFVWHKKSDCALVLRLYFYFFWRGFRLKDYFSGPRPTVERKNVCVFEPCLSHLVCINSDNFVDFIYFKNFVDFLWYFCLFLRILF